MWEEFTKEDKIFSIRNVELNSQLRRSNAAFVYVRKTRTNPILLLWYCLFWRQRYKKKKIVIIWKIHVAFKSWQWSEISIDWTRWKQVVNKSEWHQFSVCCFLLCTMVEIIKNIGNTWLFFNCFSDEDTVLVL